MHGKRFQLWVWENGGLSTNGGYMSLCHFKAVISNNEATKQS